VDRLARTRVEMKDGEVQLDAQVIAGGFDLEPACIPALLRDGTIASLCECGIDEDAGQYRLTGENAKNAAGPVLNGVIGCKAGTVHSYSY
jgi:hypothetical protein